MKILSYFLYLNFSFAISSTFFNVYDDSNIIELMQSIIQK